MDISFTTTAMARPDIVDRTYKSFASNLEGVDFDKTTLYINIDPLPKEIDRNDVVQVCEKYFGKVVANLPDSANFTKAVNWCWSEADTDYIFHLEDDWVLCEQIRMKHLLRLFNKSRYSVPLRAYEYRYDKVCLSPSLMHRRFYKNVAGNLDESKNPEIQLRGDNFDLNMTSKRVIAYPDRVVVKDIGRSWIDQTKFKKPDEKYKFTTWVSK